MALSGVKPPEMDWAQTNLPDTWKKFRQHVQLIFNGPLKSVDEETQRTYLLLWVGQRGRDIYSTWTFTVEDEKKLDPLFAKFEQYVQPKANPVFSRFKFNNIVQGNSTFDEFVTKLRIAVKDCSYANADEAMRDRIVFGVNTQKVRESLIKEGQKLTLDKAVEIGQSYEYAQTQLRSMSQSDSVSLPANTHSSSLHTVRTRGNNSNGPRGKNNNRRQQRNDFSHAHKDTQKRHTKEQRHTSTCGNCGYVHTSKNNYKCPAKGEQCKKCLKWNHFAAKCRSVACVSVDESSEHETESSNNFDDFYVDVVNSNATPPHSSDQAFVNIKLGPQKKSLSFKLDTGAQVNVVPSHTFRNILPNKKLDKPTKHLSSYNGSPIKTLGSCQVIADYKGKSKSIEIYIADSDSANTPVLGLQACLDLELIKLIYAVDKSPSPIASTHATLDKQSVLTEYSDIFQGIGKFPGKCTIHVDPEVQPIVNPPRKVPVALRDKLKEELDRMEQADVIRKVDMPTPWVNSLVVVEKSSGKLRVCLDPQNLNKAIKRPHYPMKTLEEILPDLTGAQFFTKLDARSGYWNLELDDSSSFLTTFNTPYGRYRFLRMPFGIHSAQDEFQRVVDASFEGLHGVNAIVDDILVYGKSRAEHDTNLRAVLDRSRAVGIKLNDTKLEVGTSQVRYFGHLLTANGLQPDPEKVSAIRDMKPPTDKGELETILGMINYLAKFAPNLSQITSPMRSLLPKNVEFSWEKPQQDAFDKVKSHITQNPVLAYFDPSIPITLQVDASKYGLGATLLQQGKPVAYASKSLTPAEVQYAQIEKEMFAILFGCKRFHQYVYGRRIDVESDHKPIESIMKKSIAVAPARLQRMMLQLQKYDIHVRHVPGKEIPVADTLSRKFMSDTYPELSEGMDTQVHTVLSNLPVSSRRMSEIKQITLTDSQMITLAKMIKDGWPAERRDCPMSVLEYWTFRDELTVMNGIVFKGSRIVIPPALRETMLNLLHSGHMGVEKCRNRARDIMFWPGMSADISDLVLNCNVCLEMRNSNAKEPMLPREIPTRPWQNVASDLFSWNDQDYLVVVDFYSKYFEVAKLSSTSSASVIGKLKDIFCRFGIPEKLISDNGPQYASEKFHEFAESWDFIHETSSPHHPESNGLAERTVQTAKRILAKAKTDGRDPHIALLEYRTTPRENGLSPSQLLMGRRLRSILPSSDEQLKPTLIDNSVYLSKAMREKGRQKLYHDKVSKPLAHLHIGETVRIKRDSKWIPAVVTKQNNPRSYTISTPDGGSYRRNRHHILKTNETPIDYTPHITNSLSPDDLTDLAQSFISPKSEDSRKITTPQKPEPVVSCKVTTPKPLTPSKLETPNPTPSVKPTPKSPQSVLHEPVYVTRSGRQVKGFMWELAPKLNALLVFAEHRYYGASLPYGPDAVKDPKKLQYLTSEQALADFAVLIQELKAKEPGAQTSKVIAFGGSYGGMLAAWLRIKYPNVVYGSLAASAPIWSFIGQIPCEAQLQVVTNSFKRESLTCVQNIRKSWGIINTMGATDSGRARLSSTFDLCMKLNSTTDTEALKSWLVEIMYNLALVDYPYPASFLEPLPGWPIKAVCEPLSAEILEGVALIEALSKAVKVYYNYTGQAKCLNVSQNDVGNFGDELWSYQVCTEMVMPFCSNGVTDMFDPAPYNFSQVSDQCYKQFKVRPRKSWVITEYLGKNLSTASNIIFSNGLLDPCSSGGVLKSISPSLTSFVIPNGAHHVDLRASNPGDTPDITKARLAEEYIIHKIWIKGENA